MIYSILPPSYYTAQELTELDESDISTEIADTAIINSPEANAYLDLLISELQRRTNLL